MYFPLSHPISISHFISTHNVSYTLYILLWLCLCMFSPALYLTEHDICPFHVVRLRYPCGTRICIACTEWSLEVAVESNHVLKCPNQPTPRHQWQRCVYLYVYIYTISVVNRCTYICTVHVYIVHTCAVIVYIVRTCVLSTYICTVHCMCT